MTAERHRLPLTRSAIAHRFIVGGIKGYIIAGLYPDGTLGEIFLHAHKEGSTLSGVMDAFATLTSIALQSGYRSGVDQKPKGGATQGLSPIARMDSMSATRNSLRVGDIQSLWTAKPSPRGPLRARARELEAGGGLKN